jgi:hypothetical protein
MTIICQDDFIQSIADALQYISYYHPPDFIQALNVACQKEQSPAAKDAMAQILNSFLVSKAIHKSRIIAFADLVMEAIREFVVEDMPVTVAVNTQGESIHQIAPKIWQKKIGRIPVIEEI